MRISQGAFSYLPDLTDAEIVLQLDHCRRSGWSVSVEFTDDPHPRNTYWDVWGRPVLGPEDVDGVLAAIEACREARPDAYVRLSAHDATRGRQTTALSFIVHRPRREPGFRLVRQEAAGRRIRRTAAAVAVDDPADDPADSGASGR